MSSSEESDAGPKRKRKVRSLEDSPGSTSSGSPIIGNSSSVRLRRRQQAIRLHSNDSDSSPILTNRRRKIMKVNTDSEIENSDDSDIILQRPSNPRRLQTDSEDSDISTSPWESDFSDPDDETLHTNEIKMIQNNSDSELSDGQSEKCPICLVSFKNQEIGTPEACDHMFCLDCLQEWSKNVNTCPVDRQEYSLILVREHLNGKVTRQIQIERPVPQNEVDIFEDPTFCEICGSNDNEDRMLLCDGCDLGFHLYCLNPPLSDVPTGSWYCESCSSNSDSEQYPYDLRYLFQQYDEEHSIDRILWQSRSNRSSRIIPRTRQTERVRRRIANNRQQNPTSYQPHDQIMENSTTVSSSSRRKKRKTRKRKIKYKTVYKIDPASGLTVAVQKRVKRRKVRKEREIPKRKTVKKRLAKQLGMCGPRNAPQSLPDIKVVDKPVTASGSINNIRHSAGIPTLDLFGQNNDLDYFTDEDDFNAGLQILVRRAPNRSDANTMRRTMRRKNIVMPEVVSSTSDLLDSILSSQEQLYARNASYSIDSTGKFKIDSKAKSKIDVNKEQATVKQTPYYNPNRSYNRYGNNQNYNRPYQNRYQRPSNNYYHSNSQNTNQSFYHNEPSSSMNYSNYGNDNNDYPQDYSSRTLSGNSEERRAENEEEEEEEKEERNQNDESELDIYSDIETVTTTKAEEAEYKPLSPPPMPTLPLLGLDDDNDSEPDMVIDDEKVQEQEHQNEYSKEETAVTSTVGCSQDFEPAPVQSYPTECDEIQSEAIQSSSLDNIKTYDYYNEDSLDGCPNTSIYSKEANKSANDDDVDSDDECPNFSIYSKESKTMALHTDLSLPSEKNTTDFQVGEISSSPNCEIDKEQGQSSYPGTEDKNVPVPDPDQMYDPEETFNEPDEPEETNENHEQSEPGQMYDLEKANTPERDSATSTLDHTYDPDNCMRTDESLATVAEKTLDPDQSYDPENVYEENSNSVDKTIDMEKQIYNFNESKDESMVEGRYDPAVPFSCDLEDSTQVNETPDTSVTIEESKTSSSKQEKITESKTKKKKSSHLLYSDSEDDENVVKKERSFAVTDINNMTEDISEEERSYTPCLDEKSQKQGLEGLDTEMISDEERNDFDEGHDLKTVSDGDALEINAKESELDLARPEDYEEGEIVDKNKEPLNEEQEQESEVDKTNEVPTEVKKTKKKEKDKTPEPDKGGNKENEEVNKDASFKKLSKSSKDRNYRDKERRPSSRNRSHDRESKREKKKEKRKELERYNVRAIIAEKPRPLIAKDQFGRDIRTTPSRSRSRSRTYTPPLRSDSRPPVRSPSKARSRRSVSRSRRSISRRRSTSKEKTRKRRKSRNYRTQSRSRSPAKKGQKGKKRKRSSSRFRKRKSDDKIKNKRRPRSRRRSRSSSPVRRPRDRERVDWSPLSQQHVSPSWTPPRLLDNAQLLRTESLTVTVNNNSNKKKKDKKKKGEKRNKDTLENRAKKRRHERERTPPPSKEVFASGDNILVSVSFNNENEKRDITTRDKRKTDESAAKKRKKKKNKKDLTGIKPVAIIDLDKSPFRELTPSPKQIIVLTDSENEDGEMLRTVQGNICDSSQQVASPERGIGPKTPPEPQVKFSLAPKAPQIRAINNPLIDPDDIETSVTNDIGSRISPGHKGPSTPQEPPNSAPSSPDAYDPFEPTKSRSPTPELQVQSNQDGHESIDSRAAIDLLEKSMNPMPENTKSLTPPLADIQPADSQSSVQVVTPDSNIDKSPDNRPAQIQNVQQTTKPVAQTIPFSSVPTTINTSTPLSTLVTPNRINILNATVISPPVASPIPQRIVLPNIIKTNSVKIPPTKSAIKSTPIKPMPSKTNKIVTRKRTQNGSGDDNILLDFDSPYSPGSSDYEDLFEPPSEIVTKPMIKGKTKSPIKHASAFDALFGSPSYNSKSKKKFGKKTGPASKTKTVGVRLDEDTLKILDELPNSAVEMQVKDKYLKKLNRQERVVEEVKLVLKPHYNKKRINKEEYKDIMRRSVPKICHNKSGEINPTKIKNLIEAYVRKVRHSKKVTSSSSVNPLKL